MQLKAIYGNALSIIFTSSPSELWLQRGDGGRCGVRGLGWRSFAVGLLELLESGKGWNANWIFTRKLGQGQAAHLTGFTGGCETLETVFVKSFTAQLKEYIPVKYAICMNILIY